MPLPPASVTQGHYAQRQLLAATAATVAARQWAGVDPAAIEASWQQRLPVTAVAIGGAQAAAARSADPYVAAALAAQGVAAAAPASVVPQSFAGPADGRSLLSLLMQPVIAALSAIRRGKPVPVALATGADLLDTIVKTEVTDAGRSADQVAATVQGADGYVRMAFGPTTCARCIILVGRWYRYSTGFLRHPGCDCVMVPAREGEDPPQLPEDIYAAMTAAERARAGWSKADQRAVADGADLTQVTNIHRGGLYVAGGKQFTREGTTKRGLAGTRLGVGRGQRVQRMTPAQIYREAGTDRAEAIRLLWRHGYILLARPLVPVGGAVSVPAQRG